MNDDTKQPWEQQPGENARQYRRFEMFRFLPPVRSLMDAYRVEFPDTKRQYAPTHWYVEAQKWKWDERCAAWDAYQDEQIEQLIAKEKAKVIKSHYALMHKRVEALNRLAEKLEAYMDDENNIWLPDVKSVGTGSTAERVDLIKFNDALISEYRATFADLAAELGHRIKKTKMDVAVTPKEYVGIDESEEGSEP
jgi:hypothetical protein